MKSLKHHTTHPYPCGYLPEKMARSEVITAEHSIDSAIFGRLIRKGYRRSGQFIYRPLCDQCHACLSVRIKAANFTPNRSQRRSWKKHDHLITKRHRLYYDPAHRKLYQRYQTARHTGGSMDQDNCEQYQNFLLQSPVNSHLIEFYDSKQLCMVSIVDILPDGLSAVYTFYEPAITHASFGTYNILWQIQLCQTLGLEYLYLGYWIKAHKKMNYKANFQPLEILTNGQWLPFKDIVNNR